MNIVTPVTQVTVAPSAVERLLSAETAAWEAYDAALAVTQVTQEVMKTYRAYSALEAALAVARADYESATQQVPQVTQVTPIHQVTGLLEAVHGLTVRYYKRDYPRVIAIVADDAAREFADSDPATQVACYPNGRTVYSVEVGGWTVRFDQFYSTQPPAKLLPVVDIAKVDGGNNGELDAMSLSELEAAMYAAPYGDAFTEYVAEWQGRLEWAAALQAAADDARAAG